MDKRIVADNDATRASLQSLIGTLAEQDFDRDMGEGWTVATAFAHLAFWDRRRKLLFERWQAGDVVPADMPDWFSDTLNDALVDEWRAIPRHEAARLAIEAATAIDAMIAALDDQVTGEIVARGETWRLTRSNHRREHIEQIERCLEHR
jgi:hypothetical protein